MEYAQTTQSGDNTTVIPIVGGGIETLKQQILDYKNHLIKSCLYEAMNATPAEAIGMLEMAHRFLAEMTVSEINTGTRVTWREGYRIHQGTIVQRMDNGTYMTVPDTLEVYLRADEIEYL